MDIVSFLLADANLIFSSAAAIMLALRVLELIGLMAGLSFSHAGGDADFDFDLDADADVDAHTGSFAGRVMRWVGVGQLPILMFMVVIFFNFAVVGWTANWMLWQNFNWMLPALLSAPFALVAAMPLVRGQTRLLRGIMPSDQSFSVTTDSLVGNTATVIVGRATHKMSTTARTYDQYGGLHVVYVRSDDPEEFLLEGDRVLLTRIDGHLFYANKINS